MNRPTPGSWRHMLDVISVLVTRDHKGRYKSTGMGMIWAIAGPVLFLLTFYFLFRLVLDLQIPRYASYVFIGIVAWTWLQTSLMEAVSTISANPGLVSQPRFPTAALPIVPVTSNLLNFLLCFPLLIIVVFIDGGTPGLSLLALPLLMLCQFVFALSLAYFVSALNVTFRDMQYILPIVLQIGYFTTPIFYNLKNVPPDVHRIMELNPMLHFLENYRAVLMDGQAPDWTALAMIFALSLALLAVTFRFFRHASHRFLEEI